MLYRPSLTREARSILQLRSNDRSEALRAVEALSQEEQIAMVCGAPPARRAELLDLLPRPEAVIPRIPEAELCFTVKALGLADAAWILEHASPEQIVACVDLDVWSGATPDRATLDAWLDVLADTGDQSFLRAARALDPELVVLFLKSRIDVVQKPTEEGWQPPKGAQTLDGQFYFIARTEGDDVAAIGQLLRGLFEKDYWTYFRMMHGVLWELDSETEEWALRWRTGRLEDLGFPTWEEAMRLYNHIRPEERAAIAEDQRPLDVGEWQLPVWIPRLPTGSDARHAIFRAIEQLDDDERRGCFYAFVAVANRVAVADRMALSDPESTPRAIEKAAQLASEGLEFIAAENHLEAVEVLRRVPIERLFRVGANLDPEGARP